MHRGRECLDTDVSAPAPAGWKFARGRPLRDVGRGWVCAWFRGQDVSTTDRDLKSQPRLRAFPRLFYCVFFIHWALDELRPWMIKRPIGGGGAAPSWQGRPAALRRVRESQSASHRPGTHDGCCCCRLLNPGRWRNSFQTQNRLRCHRRTRATARPAPELPTESAAARPGVSNDKKPVDPMKGPPGPLKKAGTDPPGGPRSCPENEKAPRSNRFPPRAPGRPGA